MKRLTARSATGVAGLVSVLVLGCSEGRGGPLPPGAQSGSGFAADALQVAEDVGRVELVFLLAEPAPEALSLPVLRSGSATEGLDFVLQPTTLSIPPAGTSATIAVDVVDDALDEAEERLVLEVDGRRAELVVTDDDPPPSLEFALPAQEVAETAGRALVPVTLSAPSGRTVRFLFSAEGDAGAFGDYSFDPGPVAIEPGRTEAAFDLALVHDELLEDTELVRLVLDAPQHAALGEQGVHELRLLDVEPPPRVSFGVTALDTTERSGSIEIPVVVEATGVPAPDLTGDGSERLPYPEARIALDVSIQAAERDTVGVEPKALVLSSSEESAKVVVHFSDDAEPEPVTRVDVSLADANGASLGTPRDASVLIHDDDRGVRVVFLAELAAGGVAFFADDLIGTDPRLLTALPEGVAVEDVSRSGDGARVAFLADLEEPGRLDLWTLELESAALARASDPVAAPQGVLDFEWSPSGERLAWRAEPEPNAPKELFSSLSDGTGTVPLVAGSSAVAEIPGPPDPPSGPLLAGAKLADGALDYAFSPDGSRIAWQADPFAAKRHELFVAPAGGGFGVQVSWIPGPSGSLAAPGATPAFAWAAGAEELAYLARPGMEGTGARLFVTPADAALPLEVSGEVTAGGRVTGFRWDPSGELLAFRADSVEDERFDLFAVRPGDEPVGLSGSLPEDADVVAGSWGWSPAGEGILWVVDAGPEASPTVHTGPAAGGPSQVVSLPMEAGSGVGRPRWSPDGARIAYAGPPVGGGHPRAFLTGPEGQDPSVVDGSLGEGESVEEDVRWAPDGSRLAFATVRPNGRSSLYTVGAAGGPPLLLLGPSLDQDGEPVTASWEADGTRLLLRARLDDGERFDVYSVRADDPTRLLRLTPPAVGGGGVLWLDAR